MITAGSPTADSTADQWHRRPISQRPPTPQRSSSRAVVATQEEEQLSRLFFTITNSFHNRRGAAPSTPGIEYFFNRRKLHHRSRAQQTADRPRSARNASASSTHTAPTSSATLALGASTTRSSTSDSSSTCPYSHCTRALRARRPPTSIHRRRQTPSHRVPAHPPSSHPNHNRDSGRRRPPSEPRRPIPPAPVPPSPARALRSLLAVQFHSSQFAGDAQACACTYAYTPGFLTLTPTPLARASLVVA